MIDEATKAAIKEKFPQALLLDIDGEEFVVRPPGRAEARRFRALVMDEKRRQDAAETLVRDCCLVPDPKALNELLERKPFFAESLSSKLLELGGMAQEVAARDLSGA